MKRLALIATVVAVVCVSPAASSAAPSAHAAVSKHRVGHLVFSRSPVRRATLSFAAASRVAIAAGQARAGTEHANVLTVQAVVSAVGPGSVTLTIGSQTLMLSLPLGLTLPASLVGQTVTLSVPFDDRNAANDDNDDEDHGGGGDHSGHGG